MPKREKARILAAMQQSTQNRGHQRAMTTELDDQPRLLSSVLRAHMETCEFTKEKVTSMRQRARDCPNYSMPTLVSVVNLYVHIKSHCINVVCVCMCVRYVQEHKKCMLLIVYDVYMLGESESHFTVYTK